MSIVISNTELEESLKPLLQCNIKLMLGNKVWRTGKLVLFNQRTFNIEFNILNKKDKIERFEIPIPFEVYIKYPNIVLFDYSLKKMGIDEDVVGKIMKEMKFDKKSKFYNTVLKIENENIIQQI